MNRPRVPEIITFVLIIGVAAGLRLPGLDIAPPELNQDEASRGVDAWQIYQTGADRHGHRWPLFLESFGPGDWTAALTTYITIPFVALLGPTTIAMRLPDALLGSATVVLVYFWLRRGRGWVFAASAAAVLATNPWHIALCRTAHESGFAPFFLAAAMLALDRAGLVIVGDVETTASVRLRTFWAAVAGVMLGLHTWCYPATRLFTPLLCLAMILTHWRRVIAVFRNHDGRRVLVSSIVGLIVGSAPIWVTALTHPERLAARAAVTLRIHAGGPISAMAADFGRNWLRNVNPRYLFMQADEMSGADLPGLGQHLAALAPLLIGGLLICFATYRRSPWARLIVAWWIIHPIPAALCLDWNPHPMRSVGGMLVYPLLAATGFAWLTTLRDAGQLARRRSVIAVVALAFMVNALYFARVYFQQYPASVEANYQTEFLGALRAADADAPVGPVRYMVTNSVVQPYIFAMWLEAVRTGRAVSTEMDVASGPRGFHQVTGWGRFAFVPMHAEGHEDAVEQFSRRFWKWREEGRSIRAIVRETEGQQQPVLARFDLGDGSNRRENFLICDVMGPAASDSTSQPANEGPR